MYIKKVEETLTRVVEYDFKELSFARKMEFFGLIGRYNVGRRYSMSKGTKKS